MTAPVSKTAYSLFHRSLLSTACLTIALGLTACGGDSNNSSKADKTPDKTAPDKVPGVVIPGVPAGKVAADLLNTKIQIADVEVTIPAGAIILDKDNLAESAALAFATIEDGDVIVFPEGYYTLPNQIKVAGNPLGGNLSNIKILGMGHNKTVLNFSGLEKGSKAEAKGVDGLYLSDIENLEIAHLTVIEAGKNAVKVENIDGLHMHHLATIWDGELSKENGAYGIYPVNSSNVLLEDTFTRGSADAGIYVGQSKHVIVRNSVAIENVAGMEIENCEDAEFYGNTAENNTGGLLVFDLPIGSGKYGDNVRVFNNIVKSNNTENFAVVSDFAGGVHVVPPGTGIIVLSTSNVEIYNNTVTDHKTTAIAATDYAFAESPEQIIAGQQAAVADGWSPNVKEITIHDNTIDNAGYAPDLEKVGDMVAVIDNLTDGAGTLGDITYIGIGESLSSRIQGMNQALTVAADAITVVDQATGEQQGGLQLAAAGSLVVPYDVAFPVDNICLSNNKNSTGDMASFNAVYDPAQVAASFDATAQMDFVTAIGGALVSADPTAAIAQLVTAELSKVGDAPMPTITSPAACTKPALVHTKVTIAGNEFGCGFDDEC